jgi:hypothetical protein
VKSCFYVLALALVLPIPATADLAPTTFRGYCVTPIENTQVRMASETVHIYVGDRYAEDHYRRRVRVEARFFMMNESADTVHIDVGFPADAFIIASPDRQDTTYGVHRILREYEEDRIYDFQVTVDGELIPDIKAAEVGKSLPNEIGAGSLWFTWGMSFPPGETVIDAVYHVRTSYYSKSIRQTLGYILSTGRYWSGTIGEAIVRAHFPEELGEIQLVGLWPEHHFRDGNDVVWHFKDFEPTRRDNVLIAYIPPDHLAAIENLERSLEEQPGDVDARINLAKLYLRASYSAEPKDSRFSEYAELAESQLIEALRTDPDNTLAWNCYLANYYKMHEKSFGPRFYQRYDIGNAQASLIRKAFEQCPDDPGVKLWFNLIDTEGRVLPDTLGYIEKERGDEKLNIKLANWGYFQPSVPREDIDYLVIWYRPVTSIAGAPYLVLKEEGLTGKDERKIAEILEKHGYYQRAIGIQLMSYCRSQGLW